MRTRDRTNARLPRRNAFRPCLEALECRLAPAVIVWDGEAGDNDWNNQTNWFNQTTLTNDVLPGSGDDAQIGAAFAAQTITRASGTGTIRSLTSEATVALTGGSLTITDDSTINNALNVSGTASLALSGLTLGGTGTLTNAALLDLHNTDVNVALDNQGTLRTDSISTSTINGALSTSGTSIIRVQCIAAGPVTLTVANGFTNNGLIELTQSGGTAQGATFNVTSGTLTNAATATIQCLPGTGGNRALNAQINNLGTLIVTQSLSINNTARTFDSSSGTIQVESGDTLTISGGTTALGSGSVLTGVDPLTPTAKGTINLTGTHTLKLASNLTLTNTKPTLTFGGAVTVQEQTAGSGATLINQVTLQLSVDTVNAALDNQGTLIVTNTGTSAINGVLSTSGTSTIRMQGIASGPTILTVANSFTNNGLIELTQSGGTANGVTLDVTTGTLTNAATGTIQSLAGTGGSRTLSAQLDNQGMLTIEQSLTITKASANHVNSGTINVNGATLSVNQPLSTTSTSIIRVEGKGDSAGAALTLADGLTNNGLIELTAVNGTGQAAALSVTSGTLVNAATGTIQSLAGTGGSRTVTAQLDNQGTLTVDQALTINKASADHVNSGTINVMDGNLFVAQSGTTPTFTNTGTIVIDGASSFTLGASSPAVAGSLNINGTPFFASGTITGNLANAGQLHIGTSPGLLTLTGDYSQDAAGTLNIELGGLTPVTEFDQLAVIGGTSALAGTLNVALINGFVPSLGDSFLILDGDTTGSFDSHDLPPLAEGLVWDVETGSVVLTVAEEPAEETDLSVLKTAAATSVEAGDQIIYTIVVSNLGAAAAVDVSLSDTLPANTTFVSFVAPSGWSTQTPAVGATGTVTASLDSLAPGATAEFELVVQVDAGAATGTVIRNTAQAATTTADVDSGNDISSADVTVTQPPTDPPAVVEVVVNGGAAQRSNLEQIAIRFNRPVNLQALIDSGAIVTAVKVLRSSMGLALDASRYQYDAASFTLTIDLTVDGFGGSQATLLKNGQYKLLLDAQQITSLDNSASTLVDDDGKVNGVWKSRFHRMLGDFDGNQVLNRSDLDLLFARLGSSAGDEGYAYFFDLKHDSLLDHGDVKAWKRAKGQS